MPKVFFPLNYKDFNFFVVSYKLFVLFITLIIFTTKYILLVWKGQQGSLRQLQRGKNPKFRSLLGVRILTKVQR